MKDRIYEKEQKEIPDFDFNEKVAMVFDDMAARSIPLYHQINKLILEFLDHFSPPTDLIYDLGCSTGSTLVTLSKHFEQHNRKFQLIGIDKSPGMITKCREKLIAENIFDVEILCSDLLEINLQKAGVIILNYTLQFLPAKDKGLLIQKIHESLVPGGVLILSEKILIPDPLLNQAVSGMYYSFKRRNGYSELEISQKRDALEKVLIPLTSQEHMTLLQTAGFRKIETFYRWYNFSGFIGIK